MPSERASERSSADGEGFSSYNTCNIHCFFFFPVFTLLEDLSDAEFSGGEGCGGFSQT